MNESDPPIDIRPGDWQIVRTILREHIPKRRVLAFGSRVNGSARKFSDLDLVIVGNTPLSIRKSAALDDSFVESDLPFKVDVVDWAYTDEDFRKIILQSAVPIQP